jgi:hypothetical protein
MDSKNTIRSQRDLSEAVSLHQAGRLNEAADFMTVIARYPKDPQLLTQLGTIARNLKG